MNLIERAEELLKAATPGPWHYNGNEVVAIAKPRIGIAGAISEDDCELIALSPTIIRGLLDLVGRQQELLKQAQYIMNFHAGQCPMNINNNYSGMSEHLAMYRDIMRQLEPFKGEIDWEQYDKEFMARIRGGETP